MLHVRTGGWKQVQGDIGSILTDISRFRKH